MWDADTFKTLVWTSIAMQESNGFLVIPLDLSRLRIPPSSIHAQVPTFTLTCCYPIRSVSAQQQTRREDILPDATPTASSCCVRVPCAPTRTRLPLRTSQSTSGSLS